MKILFFIFLYINSFAQTSSTILSTDEETLKADIEASTRYNYNIFYSYDNLISDFSLYLTPKLRAQTKPKALQLSAMLDLEYEKFLSYSSQDYFNYSLKTLTTLNEGSANSFTLGLDYAGFSDPAMNSSVARVQHQRADANLSYAYIKDNGDRLKLKLNYKYEDILAPSYTFNPNYLRHYNAELVGQYDFRFLPETYWFLRLTGGMREYTNPTLGTQEISNFVTATGFQSIKTSNMYGLGEVGISGRLTDKTIIDAATGFLVRMYPTDDSFVAPVFYIHFIEQVTRRDQLIAGYNYVVEDAYSTNWFLNQEIYIGLARVMGDQVLLLVKMSYEYKNYSTPLPRNDQRVTGGGIIKYSFKPHLKFFGEMKVDLMATDYFFNHTSALNAADRPGSYRAGYIGAGVMANF
ncbi:MAG: outer membrane beta-barrel protein [Oligoflexia bacterium]|nr:outer membrane beta-barrel protein [Oligoflexia bacterium]